MAKIQRNWKSETIHMYNVYNIIHLYITVYIKCVYLAVETTRQDIKSLETSNVPLTDMSRMYEMAGHTMNEMLQK